ncbi:hypothetical protein BH23ACT10_BH23ACT10_18850 [soil metagenome]
MTSQRRGRLMDVMAADRHICRRPAAHRARAHPAQDGMVMPVGVRGDVIAPQ